VSLAVLASRATSSVRRAERRRAIAIADKNSPASRQLAGPPSRVRAPAPMEFLILEDNGGSYHWKILAGDGSTLGQSGDFASYDAAERAAQQICNGAAAARVHPRGWDRLRRSRRTSRCIRGRPRRRALAGRTRQLQQRGGGPVAAATLIAPAEPLPPPSESDPRRTYSCPECEHGLRVSGLGRHRVYFELSDERSQDPVMNRTCPACEHRLPGKNAPSRIRLEVK
jgi:uncharacterized protein YegP (UPF0339 family)/uncharacterized protein YlaI